MTVSKQKEGFQTDGCSLDRYLNASKNLGHESNCHSITANHLSRIVLEGLVDRGGNLFDPLLAHFRWHR